MLIIAVAPVFHIKTRILQFFYAATLSIGFVISWSGLSSVYVNPINVGFMIRAVYRAYVTTLLIFSVGLIAYMLSLLKSLASSLIHSKEERRNSLFYSITIMLTLVVSCFLLEILSSFFVPPFPARELRPIHVKSNDRINSWSVRDRERTIEKPDGAYRILFIGDSFLEGHNCQNTLPGYVEQRLHAEGIERVECINLGISGTGPKHYFHRMKAVGLDLDPDEIFLFFYEGNDFLLQTRKKPFIQLIAERPMPSFLGMIMPRFTWLAVNRLNYSEFQIKSEIIPNETAVIDSIRKLPYEKRIDELARIMSRYYFPDETPETLEKILDRGGEEFWEVFDTETEREYLSTWRIKHLLQISLEKTANKDRIDIVADEGIVNTTFYYIGKGYKAAEKASCPMTVFMIPIAEKVDPAYRSYWSPWYSNDCNPAWREVHSTALMDKIREENIPLIDLASILDGIPETYRKHDGHWTEKGHCLVEEHIAGLIIRKEGNR